MKRSTIFTAGVAIIILIIIIVAMAVLQMTILQKNKNPYNNTNHLTFSNSTIQPNMLPVLQHNRNKIIGNQTKNNTPKIPTNEQAKSIQSIIQSWQTKIVPSKTQATRAQITKQKKQTSPNTDNENILALFKRLIGTNIADTIAVQNGPATRTKQDNTTIKNGLYKNNNLFATSDTPTQTTSQLALYKYGNDLGALFTTFNISQSNQTDILSEFIKNRKDTESLKKLTNGYIQLSKDIDKLTVPPQVTTINIGLVSSYKSVGELLWALSLAENDNDMMKRILTYNKSSAEVAKYQVSLITLFKANGVKFEKGDSGSIFSFSPASSKSF